ncbi:MAG TPA: GLUG motif-containing protein [Sulfuriferula sp.]|nr:GLUG motif-containing protein [Sulfuriferula sp.]
MNHIYRSIWNDKTGTFVAVSENAKSGGRKASTGASIAVGTGFALKALAVSLMLGFGSASYALPVGGVVAAGSASVTSGNGSMTVNQSSQNVVLNWQSFNIGAAEAVRFVQPNSSAVALNRVIGADPSSILGSLSANGKVFLVNPNGILFGKSASVNVGGLVASTRNVSDSDFMAGNYKFAGAGNGSILNQGAINADGGYVALLGANVSNEGTINARLGTIALAAGNAITLDVAGDGLLNVKVDQGTVNALVSNGGMLQADGGEVLLTAQAAGTLLRTAVNNTGIIQAQTIENHNGTIKLLGDMQSGTVNVGGKLDASAPNNGNGGAIETSAAHVKVNDNARITTSAPQGLTGSWLIDPTDYTIAASGGDITGAALSTNLGSTDVTILSTSGGSGSSGNVNVNDAVSWSANTLTLNAQNNININANLNASSTASLALEFGQGAVAAGNISNIITHGGAVNLPAGTSNFTTKQGSDGSVKAYTVITSLGAAGSATTTDLQGMYGNKVLNYALGANIDATATSSWNTGAGFVPIGAYGTSYLGTFDGLGHTISNLTINRTGTDNVGLFGYVGASGSVLNVGLLGGSAAGNKSVGGLVGRNVQGTISNSYATGAVSGSNYTGGLVGCNDQGTVSNSYATGTVSGNANLGGLVGSNLHGTVSNSYATGAVSGNSNVGGLVGYGNNYGTISNSYATGTVSGNGNVGGLVGFNYQSTVSNSYATGAVSGSNNVGGLVGYGNGGTVSNSYASGAVSGSSYVGGLVGYLVSGGTVTASFWNTTTSGQGASAGGTGLNSVEMQTASNFTGFTFTTTPGAAGNNWVMVDVDGTLNNAGSALGATRPMLASEYATTITNAHQLQLMSMDLAASYTLGKNISAAATGSANDVWSGSTFIPVGTFDSKFTGTFDGLDHTISNLTINLPTTDYVGLFGRTGTQSVVHNVGLEGGSVMAQGNAGALMGRNDGIVRNSYATGSVDGSTIAIGGLVGQNYGTVSNSYATGAATNPSNGAGGLVGAQHSGSQISNSYATGNVSSSSYAGGLLGINDGGAVSNSYSTGAVSGSSYVGGLVGRNYNGTVSNSFWNTTTSGQATSSGGTGMSTADMQTQANFMSATAANGNANPGWDLIGTWVIYDGHTSPLLRSFMTALTVTAGNASKTYDGLAYSGGNGVTYSTTPNGNLLGTVSYSSGINVGSATITPGGLYSNQQGYIISYVNGALTVNKADLTLGGTRAYDGTSAVAGSVLTATGVNGETFAISGAGDSSNLASKNVQTGSTLGSLTALALGTSGNGGLSGNYNALSTTGSAVSVTKADLTLATSDVSKTYDGGLSAAGNAIITNGALFGTDAISGGTFAFTDKNVGSNKTVTTTGVTLTDGNSGGNYNVAYADNTASTITPKALTVAGETALDKVYDGTTSATLAGGALAGVISGDEVSLIEAGLFATPNVGNGIAVAAVDSLGGSSAGNYAVTQPTGLTADITAPVSVIGSDPRDQNAIASAVSTTSVMPLQGNMADAQLPSAQDGGDSSADSSSSATNDASPSIQHAISSMPGGLTGLNLSIAGSGVKLPPGVRPSDARDDKN